MGTPLHRLHGAKRGRAPSILVEVKEEDEMIDLEDGKRAGKQAALQCSTSARSVRAAILAKLPAAREEARLLAARGDEWGRAAAAYWLEFYDSFEETSACH